MTVGVAALIGLLGTIIGSFVNVVAHRVPQGMSIVRPPSSCPACGARIRPRDNVPVIGWLVLRGRCRDCGERISVRYPGVELATGALFFGIAVVVGASWTLPAYLWAGGVSVALFLTDLDHKRLPNRILYPGIVVSLALLGVGAGLDGALGSFWRGVGGAAVYFAVLLLIAIAARGGFGMGDVKLAVLLGLFAAYLSWESLFVAAIGGFVIGGLIAIVLLLLRRAGRKDAIPFGPAMILGAYVAVAWGDAIGDWYLG